MSAVVELRPNRGTPYDQTQPRTRQRRTQPKDALVVGNERRLAWANLRRGIQAMGKRNARLLVADLVEVGGGSVAHVHLDVLLLAVPGVGEANLRRLLWRPGAPVWPRLRVGELTVGQRVFVAGELRKTGR